MKITDFEKYEFTDYYDYGLYFYDLISNKHRLVAHNWDSHKHFGQIILLKG